MRQIDYWFMHHVQANNQINLPALIFQDLIKVIRDSIKTIPYGMHLSISLKRRDAMLMWTHIIVVHVYNFQQAYLGEYAICYGHLG